MCYSRPKVYTCPQNFIWMCSLSRLPVTKNPTKFWANLDIWGLLCRTPFINEGHIWCARAGPWYTLTYQNFVWILSPFGGEKKTNFDVFWTSAFCNVASWQLGNNVKKLNLQHLQGEIVRTISDVHKRDRQTNRQKTRHFCPPAADEIRAPLNFA